MADAAFSLLSLGGDIVARASGTVVEVLRGSPFNYRTAAQFTVQANIDWLDVAPDGKSVLIWGGRATRLWLWRCGRGHELIAVSNTRVDKFGAGFVTIDGEIVVALTQRGVLRGIAENGLDRFTANVASPRNFLVRGLASLPGNRLGLFGDEAAEPFNQIVTVAGNDLMSNHNAVQEAFLRRTPIFDRASRLAVGPCDRDSAVVYRNFEDEEIPEDEEDTEEISDVGGFTGVYVRNLSNGKLIERIPYAGQTLAGVRIVATRQLIVLQVVGGLAVIARGSREAREIRADAAALDVAGMRAAWLNENGRVEIAPISTLL